MDNYTESIKKSFSQQTKNIQQSHIFNLKDLNNYMIDFSDIDKDSIVLDLGCGTGLLTRDLAKLSNNVYALDLTKEMLIENEYQCGKENIDNITFTLSNADKTPYQDNTFTHIFTRQTFHHFDDLNKILTEIKRILKPNGKLIIADIITSENKAEAKIHNALEKIRDHSHTKCLSKTEIESLLKKYNFIIDNGVDLFRERDLFEWLKITNQEHIIDAYEDLIIAMIRANIRTGLKFKVENTIKFLHSLYIVSATLK